MARNPKALVYVLLAVASLLYGSVAQTTSYVVGDSTGWTIPSNGSQFYVNWTFNKTFNVGDTLVFNYANGVHDVAKVTKSGFDSCDGTNPLWLLTNSSKKVILNQGGQQYFICTFAGHCSIGQKLSINVAGGGSNFSPWNWKRKVALGGSVATATLLMCIIIYCFRGRLSIKQVKFRFNTENDRNIEAFLKDHGALSQKRYKFSEIKKMTNSFKIKLGQGGFGVVYKGKLKNGRFVAVKILNASKGNSKDFINEVASISRTSHVNVVTLLGFCFEGRKIALIYELMPNGSLDNFIYKKGPQNIASLSWEKLFEIAKGIAQGLDYLHRGCNTRILHFDIKPHNILLDENFCPKISDFGLAKLCPEKESIISMSKARGTIGYIAPEVWNRQFGGVSQKSDIYSYGMMILEMVGVRKNIDDANGNQKSEYFPDWIYNKLEMDSDLRTDGVVATEEDEIARGMTIVGLWCIQTFPNDRPTISKVIEMLEGNIKSLQIPPKPMLSSPKISSPARSVTGSSTS